MENDVSTQWAGAVAQIERAATAKGRQQIGCYAIEGLRLHERALRAGVAVKTAVLSQRLWAQPNQREQALLNQMAHSDCQLIIAPDATLAQLSAGRGLGEIVGLVALPPTTTLAEQQATAPQGVWLTAVDIIDPGNVGALLRTAHASGCAGLLTVGRSDVFHPRAVRTSMGSLFKLPTAHFDTADELLTTLQALGVQTVATAVDAATLLPQATFTERATAILMGNEYWGLPADIVRHIDQPVAIPMPPGVDSFSVNAAAAVVLYEIQRQRLTN